jgi:hypothetical protein
MIIRAIACSMLFTEGTHAPCDGTLVSVAFSVGFSVGLSVPGEAALIGAPLLRCWGARVGGEPKGREGGESLGRRVRDSPAQPVGGAQRWRQRTDHA